MVASTPPDAPAGFYPEALRRALARVRDGGRVHVPPAVGLHRRQPRAHFHATPELFIQTGGASDFVCPGGAFRLRTGELALIPRGVPHAETPLSLRTAYGIVVCMHARDGFLLHRARAEDGTIVGYATVHPASAPGRDAFAYLDAIAAAERVPAGDRPRYITALLEAFLLTILAELEQPSAGAHPASPLVAQAEMLARTRLADPTLAVATLARALRCSPDHLSRTFHRERGLTLSAWVTRERMGLARDLLATPHYNVSEVAWACGYTTPSYFIRVFQRAHGVTPRAYRRSRGATG